MKSSGVQVVTFTEEWVEALQYAAKGERLIYRDSKDKYLHLRLSAKEKTFLVIKKAMGRTFFVTLGTSPTLKLSKWAVGNDTFPGAKELSRQAVMKLDAGINPTREKQDTRAAEQAQHEADKVMQSEERVKGVTLQQSINDYLACGKLKPRTVDLYKRLFDLHLSDWLEMPIIEISKDMVKDRHRDIANGTRQRNVIKKEVAGKGKNKTVSKVVNVEPIRREASADGTMRVLRAVLNYAFAEEAEEHGRIYANPVMTLSRKKANQTWYKVAGRRTLVKNSDLPAWHKAVVGLDNGDMRDYLLFLLFTGLRRNEAATLKWKQIDFEEECFTLPGGMTGTTKNKQPHTLPLSDYLHNLLQDRNEALKQEHQEASAELKKAKCSTSPLPAKTMQAMLDREATAAERLASPYVFPGTGKSGYIQEPKRAIDAVTEQTGIIFSCHDLRRTFATIAESLDLSMYSVKALLNHKQQTGDVTGGYIQINVERLRKPMQAVTDALTERINTKRGEVATLTGRKEKAAK